MLLLTNFVNKTSFVSTPSVEITFLGWGGQTSTCQKCQHARKSEGTSAYRPTSSTVWQILSLVLDKMSLFHFVIVFRKRVSLSCDVVFQRLSRRSVISSDSVTACVCVCAGAARLSVCDRCQGLCWGQSGIMGGTWAREPAVESQWGWKHLLTFKPQPGAGPQR